MKPQKIVVDGSTGFVYGKVTRKDGTELKIAAVYFEKSQWPRLPISVVCWGGEFVDCSDHLDAVENWKKRGDLDLHEGWPK